MKRSPLATDSTLKHALERYAGALAARQAKDRTKSLERDLHTLHKIFDSLAAATARPLPKIRRRELGSGLREATAVAGLSDVHCEERVRLGETPVPNVYSLEIAERSIARFFEAFRWHLDLYRARFKIRDALVWLGGDLMTGHIHEELKENTAFPPIETLLWLRPRLLAGFDRLLEDSDLECILVPCSYGNHGRNTAKPYRALGASHSYEWLLYQWLSSLYENNPRIQFLADQSAHQYAHAYDFDLHFHHGDETNYQGGIGGITIPINKATSQWDKAKRCDYHHFGHWHQYVDTGRIVVNGSVIGFNSYAMSIKAEPEPPAQFFYLLDSKRGKTAKSPLWVRDSADVPRKTCA
jgi:hypothetical protein